VIVNVIANVIVYVIVVVNVIVYVIVIVIVYVIVNVVVNMIVNCDCVIVNAVMIVKLFVNVIHLPHAISMKVEQVLNKNSKQMRNSRIRLQRHQQQLILHILHLL